jgi:two-component system chemotaxis response regulator CheY
MTARGTLLLVDDSSSVLRATTRALEHAGFVVFAAECARDALDVLRAHADGIDAVITDFSMPLMSGLDLARHVHDTAHRVPVIVTSAFVPDEDDANAAPGPGAPFAWLVKPFSAPALIDCVERAMAARSRQDLPES